MQSQQRNNRRQAPKSAPTDKAEQQQPNQQQQQPPATSPRSRIYRQPCRQRFEDGSLHVYLFEVHDFVDKKTYGERFWGQIRDITSQTAVEIPLSLIKPLIEHLMTCKSDEEAELEHDEDDEKETDTPPPAAKLSSAPAPTLFDLELLETKQIRGLEDTFALEIGMPEEVKEDAPTTKLLCSVPLAEKHEPTAGGDSSSKTPEEERRDILKPMSKKGNLVITEWLIPRLILFLKGIYIRHLDFSGGCPEVRNLYAPSGSRRFYFDIHETKWGARLQISQVTAMHRNTVSIPLESLVLFRNRLNMLIDRLGIDDFTDLRVARAPRPARDSVPPAAPTSPNRNRKPRVKANGRAGVRPYRRPYANRYFTPLRG